MAAYSSAKSGFNQSGGAYFIVISDIALKLNAYTPGTGSGGANGNGSVALVLASELGGVDAALAAGKLIKDMGKSVVVAGVTYRKFQAVQTPSDTNAGGQMGKSPSYFSFYLEVGRDGARAVSPAGIARYF